MMVKTEKIFLFGFVEDHVLTTDEINRFSFKLVKQPLHQYNDGNLFRFILMWLWSYSYELCVLIHTLMSH